MTAAVFVGTSVDGFIARRNDDLDFLPEGGGEAHGYDEFIAGIDAIVMGRKTYEKVLTFGAWPYAGKRVVVLSGAHIDTSAVPGEAVEWTSGNRPRSSRGRPLPVHPISTSTAASRFSAFCVPG